MNRMKTTIVALVVATGLTNVIAAENFVSGQVLLDRGVKKVPIEEMKAIVRSGVEVETYLPTTGAYRLWTNDASGKFIASRRGGKGNARSQGTGEWKLTETGEYCVQIDWRTANNVFDWTEKWCRVLYKYEDALYLAPNDLSGREEEKFSKVQFK